MPKLARVKKFENLVVGNTRVGEVPNRRNPLVIPGCNTNDPGFALAGVTHARALAPARSYLPNRWMPVRMAAKKSSTKYLSFGLWARSPGA